MQIHSYMHMLSLMHNSPPVILSAQKTLQHLNNLITHLLRAPLPTQVLCSIVETAGFFAVKNLLHSMLDEGGFFALTERVPEHHGGGENSTDGVGDALTGNVRSGTVDTADWSVGVCKEERSGSTAHKDPW